MGGLGLVEFDTQLKNAKMVRKDVFECKNEVEAP